MHPTSRGQWQIAARSHTDTTSVVGSVRILDKLPRSAVYEIYSLRGQMNEVGTGVLASMAISDGAVPGSIGNNAAALLNMGRQNSDAVQRPDIFWFWGRTAQFQGPENADVYLPPDFFWTSEMHGVFQNGAGASIVYMWTVVYRVVTFSTKDFANVTHKMAPMGSTKRTSSL